MDKIRILIIGQGSFGKYITENIIKPLHFNIVNILRSKDFDKIKYYAEHKELYDRIYIALPYELHHPVIKMFPEDAPILCEKPILGYDSLPKIRMGYHRIFDRYFINAKLDIQKKIANGETPRVRIVSKDTDEGNDDTLDWLYCAMCHDLHMCAFLDTNVAVNDVVLGKKGSDITVQLKGDHCKFTIEYNRDWATYVQEIVVDNVVYGYDSEVFSQPYEETYRREFMEFARYPKPDHAMESLQHEASNLLLSASSIICKKYPNAMKVHREKYTKGIWLNPVTKQLIGDNIDILPYEPIQHE